MSAHRGSVANLLLKPPPIPPRGRRGLGAATGGQSEERDRSRLEHHGVRPLLAVRVEAHQAKAGDGNPDEMDLGKVGQSDETSRLRGRNFFFRGEAEEAAGTRTEGRHCGQCQRRTTRSHTRHLANPSGDTMRATARAPVCGGMQRGAVRVC